MFTFIAGVPGTGKTLFLVDELAHNSIYRDRQVFVDGIPGLDQDAIPHTKLPFDGTLYEFELERDGTKKIDENPDSPTRGSYIRINPQPGLCTAHNWPEWVMPGDLLIVDECQRHWRNRANGAHVPLAVTELEVHRSRYSVDIVYASQKPSLVDAAIRAQVGRFLYIRKGWFGRYLYDADEMFNFESRAERSLQKKTRYKLPKRSFPLYISASLHTKQKVTYPKVLLLLPLVLVFLVWKGYSLWLSHDQKTHPEKYQQASAAQATRGELASTGKAPEQVSSGVVNRPAPKLDDYKPVIPGRPETAPIFDELRKVVVMPRVAACVQKADRCICYSQQGTRLSDVSGQYCQQILANGPGFDPYKVPDGALVADQAPQSAPKVKSSSSEIVLAQQPDVPFNMPR